MNQRTPADRSPVVSKESVTSALVPGICAKPIEPTAEEGADQQSIEPPKSFFRGVAVGIAIMIPLWTWLILWLLR